jgi:hypothetical protein
MALMRRVMWFPLCRACTWCWPYAPRWGHNAVLGNVNLRIIFFFAKTAVILHNDQTNILSISVNGLYYS